MIVYTKITLALHKSVKLIEKKKDVYTFEFSSLEEAKEATRILKHRGVGAFLDEDSHYVKVYDVDDFNIETVCKDFELTICF